ncbi:hypothetical protein DFAR_10007 [Desulfarculales bacterium]
MDEVLKAEAKEHKLPKATRWAVLKAADGGRLTEKQQQALIELEIGGFATAWRLKKMLRWIRKATSVRICPMAHHPLHPPYPEVYSAWHQDPGLGTRGAHDSAGRACSPDPKPLDRQSIPTPAWRGLTASSKSPEQEPEATVMSLLLWR